MVSLKVFNSVGEELRRIEQAYDVRVLYACESGSRAWGFASQDSDYDVRFIYVHSRDWYLSIEDRRDVIEEPIREGLDLSGWELRKTLRLLRKSNPPLLEWLKSPVVYAWDEAFVADFRQLADEYYSPARCFQHYLHMAFGHGELAEEVFVDLPEGVVIEGGWNFRDHLQQFLEQLAVKNLVGLGENAGEVGVVPLDVPHRVVDGLPHLTAFRQGQEMVKAGVGREIEDTLGVISTRLIHA